MVRAVRQLGHSKSLLSRSSKSVKPVLSGHLRELESRALPLRLTTLMRFFFFNELVFIRKRVIFDSFRLSSTLKRPKTLIIN